MPCSFDGKEVSFFSTMGFLERDRYGWEELFNKTEEIRNILKGRFTDSWPKIVPGICHNFEPITLAPWP